MENPFVKLFAIDFKDHLEVKKSGNTELKYVSWAYAWAEVKKLYPAASYEVKKFNGLPYVYDPITGFMVYTSVTIEGVSHEMWLPVLDGANKAMKAVPYTYSTPKWDYNPQTRRREKVGMEERTVEAASMFDVNKAIMRCLVKNLAMFGLGLYVYDPITGFMVYTSVTIEGVSHEMWLPVLDGANKAMKAVPYTYSTPKWDYNPQTRRREKVGMEERTVEAASMFDVNKAIMRCLVKNLAMFGLGLYVYAGEDLPEDAAPQPEAEPQKQPKPKSTSQKQEQPPVPCICARCNQPIKRVKLKDGSIMQAAEFAATHEGMCADCYKATRLNVA